jgi:transcriptional regulator with XRE-family HTH domain
MSESAPIYVELGKRIRAARKGKRLTQARLAEVVSLTRTSITNIEKGRQKLLIHTLYDLAGALGVSPRDLLPEENGQLVDGVENQLPKDLSDKERSWLKAVMKDGSSYDDSKENNPKARRKSAR